METFDFAKAARESGFTTVAPLDVTTLKFLPEVREMCASDRCQSYNRNWACPPACGTLEQWQERCAAFPTGLLLQTVGDREDSYDFEAMMDVMKEHAEHIYAMAKKLRAQDNPFVFLTAGTCTRCKTCTYPDAPCRFPEDLFPSMEACGLFVSQVCTDNQVPYYYGDQKIAYTSCVLFSS